MKKKPFYKRWWFIAVVVIGIVGAIGGSGDEGEAEAEGVTSVEVQPASSLTNEELTALEEGLQETVIERYDYLTLHSFDYEDDTIVVWVDMQPEETPSKLEAENTLGEVTWYLTEVTEVETSADFEVQSILVTSEGDGFIHWLTEHYKDGEYTLTEEEAFDLLPE